MFPSARGRGGEGGVGGGSTSQNSHGETNSIEMVFSGSLVQSDTHGVPLTALQ